MALPIIDMSALSADGSLAAKQAVAARIAAALVEDGFFYAVGHGIEPELTTALQDASRAFFALPEDEKLQIAMARGGRAWRGYFPVGGELTSGAPDLKEGIYFGTELASDHPAVRAGTPLHGANLFPARPAEFKPLVLRYMREASAAAQALMEGVALSLGLPGNHFARTLTYEPTCLFRIFHYPPAARDEASWGVGEHTDMGC